MSPAIKVLSPGQAAETRWPNLFTVVVSSSSSFDLKKKAMYISEAAFYIACKPQSVSLCWVTLGTIVSRTSLSHLGNVVKEFQPNRRRQALTTLCKIEQGWEGRVFQRLLLLIKAFFTRVHARDTVRILRYSPPPLLSQACFSHQLENGRSTDK